jgi:hypothetical protein
VVTPSIKTGLAFLQAHVTQRHWARNGRLNLCGDYSVAGDSESGSWNGIVMFNRRFGETMALNLGYRYYANEYKRGSGVNHYLWDMKIAGPMVGYTWQFGGTRWP